MGDLLENGWRSISYRNVVGLPTRSLGAVDEFMKTLRYRAVVQAKASVEVNALGLSGQEARDLLDRRMAEAFDAEGRALDAEALREAETATFQQDLVAGSIGETIQAARHKHPALGLVLPFVKTPINVLRYAWKMTPGLNLLQKEYREMLSGKVGPEAQAQAIGQMSLAATFMGLAAHLAVSGRLTGGGPEDPALRSSLKASGWQPYSIVFDGEDGKKVYFPLGRFDPVGLPVGIVADLVDAERLHPNSREVEKGRAALLLSLARNFTDKTFLLSINQVLRAATDPERNLGRTAGTIAGNALPLSSLFRMTNPDPYVRDARGFTDQIMKNLPGFSALLPPKRDAFGEPLWSRLGVTSTYEADVVEAEHNRIIVETGEGIGLPSPSRHGVDLRDVTLSDGRNAYDRLQELVAQPMPGGRSLKDALAKMIQSKGYSTLVDGPGGTKGTKLYALNSLVGKYRAAAFKVLLVRHPELRRQLYQRQMEIKSQVTANRAAEKPKTPSEVEKMLQSMGY